MLTETVSPRSWKVFYTFPLALNSVCHTDAADFFVQSSNLRYDKPLGFVYRLLTFSIYGNSMKSWETQQLFDCSKAKDNFLQ